VTIINYCRSTKIKKCSIFYFFDFILTFFIFTIVDSIDEIVILLIKLCYAIRSLIVHSKGCLLYDCTTYTCLFTL